MLKVKEGNGLIGAPANACQQVIDIADFVSNSNGGDGAVREFVEYLISFNEEEIENMNLEKRCLKALDFLSHLKEEDLSLGRHDVDETFYYNVQEYDTKVDALRHFESHIKYVDIQILISGVENLQVIDINRLKVETPYNETKECIYYYSTNNAASTILRPGSAIILYPKDAHRTLALNENSCHVKKIIGKVKI